MSDRERLAEIRDEVCELLREAEHIVWRSTTGAEPRDWDFTSPEAARENMAEFARKAVHNVQDRFSDYV